MIFNQSWNFWQDPPFINIMAGFGVEYIKIYGDIYIDKSIIIDDRIVNMIIQQRQGGLAIAEQTFSVKQGWNSITLNEFMLSGACSFYCVFEGGHLPDGWYPSNISQIKFAFNVERRK